MNEKDQRHHVSQSARRAVMPPWSNRTLHHPSFLPFYLGVGSPISSWDIQTQEIPPMIPSEFFYTDPTMQCGRRIPNTVSELQTLECYRLNTPPPIMSACPVPPIRPDPFRAGRHPTRHLGSPTWRRFPGQRLPRPCPSGQRRAVIQLTLEEDQAITNLLKLHYQDNTETDSLDGVSKLENTMATDSGRSLMDQRNLTVPTLPLDTVRCFQSNGHPLSNSFKTLFPLPELRSDVEMVAANTLLTLCEERFGLNKLLDIGTGKQNPSHNHGFAAGKCSENPQKLLLQDSGSSPFVDTTVYPVYTVGSRVGCNLMQETQHGTAVKIDSALRKKQSIAGNSGILLESRCEGKQPPQFFYERGLTSSILLSEERHKESELEDSSVFKETKVTEESEEVAVSALLGLGDFTIF